MAWVGGMGCLSCARGKFLKAHPFSYPLWARPGDDIFSKEMGRWQVRALFLFSHWIYF